jgi:hypothetical protein
VRHIPVIVCVLALTGCGTVASSSNFEGTEREVAEAVEGLQEAAGRLDEARLCQNVLAQALITRLEAGGQKCQKEVSSALEDTDAVGLRIEDVKVSGSSATATVKAREGEDDVLREIGLVLERGDWRVAELGTARPAPEPKD